jgi:hypothetical protein
MGGVLSERRMTYFFYPSQRVSFMAFLIALRRSFVIASAAAVLAGCVTTNFAPDPTRVAPKANDTVVVVSVTGNTAQVSAADSITVQRVDDAMPKGVFENHVLSQVAPGLSRDTALFVGTLPAGTYRVSQFGHTATRQFLSITKPMSERIGTFAVSAGQGVDLGRLVVTPVNSNVVVGRSTRARSNMDLLRQAAPQYLSFFPDGKAAPGWLTGRNDTDRVEEYALATPVGADNPVLMSDGSIVMGSRLGSALVRNPEGRWRVLRSDGLESLLSVKPADLPDTFLVAVGEFRTMLRLPKGGTRFEAANPGNLPQGNLLFVTGNAKDGWVVAAQNGKAVNLYRSANFDNGDWKLLRTEDVGVNFWTGTNRFWIWDTPQGLGYAVTEGRIHFLNLAAGTWTDSKSPKASRLIAIAQDVPGQLGALTSPGGGFGGVFAGMYTSADNGLNWKEIKGEFTVKVSPPRQMPNGDLLLPGGVFSKQELHGSKDGGTSWAPRSEFALDQQLVVLPNGQLLAVSGGRFGIFNVRHSSDGGATWRTEYTNFDRQVYDAQQKK